MKDMVTDVTECTVNLLNTPVVSMMILCIKNNGKLFFRCSVLAQLRRCTDWHRARETTSV